MNKIAIFVDVQNIYYTTREAYSRQFNYREFWRQIKSTGLIVVANAYATLTICRPQHLLKSLLLLL